jgi:1,4-dihydroxy-2-naphthoate octaprenyltransferase
MRGFTCSENAACALSEDKMAGDAGVAALLGRRANLLLFIIIYYLYLLLCYLLLSITTSNYLPILVYSITIVLKRRNYHFDLNSQSAENKGSSLQ